MMVIKVGYSSSSPLLTPKKVKMVDKHFRYLNIVLACVNKHNFLDHLTVIDLRHRLRRYIICNSTKGY